MYLRSLPLLMLFAATPAESRRADSTHKFVRLFSHGRTNYSQHCDPLQQDIKKYGARIKALNVPQCASPGMGNCLFWDACPPLAGGRNCPSGCESFAPHLSWSQRAFNSIGRAMSGSCQKFCRYSDEAVLGSTENRETMDMLALTPRAAGVMTTSAVVLKDKLELQAKKCKGRSLSGGGCGVRWIKIGNLLGTVMRGVDLASKAARIRGMKEHCEDRLPRTVRPVLVESLQILGTFLEQMGSAVHEIQMGPKQVEVIAKFKAIVGEVDANFCARAALSTASTVSAWKTEKQMAVLEKTLEESVQFAMSHEEEPSAAHEGQTSDAAVVPEVVLSSLEEMDSSSESLVVQENFVQLRGVFKTIWWTLYAYVEVAMGYVLEAIFY